MDEPTADPPADPPADLLVDPFADVVGQPEAVAQLRAALGRPVHAYLFVGPSGTGSRQAARAFAGDLLAGDSTGEVAARHRRLARLEAHPDLIVVEREGPFITVAQAQDIVKRAVRSPVEGAVKVLLLTEFHLVDRAAPMLLKTIEEPPPSTVFVILADEISPELVTIASRCAVVHFAPLTTEAVVASLVADGIDPPVARAVADAAAGDLERARLLAGDPGLVERMEAWRRVPDQLDGTGMVAARVAAGLVAQLEASLAPIDARQRDEMAALVERDRSYGLSAAGQRQLETRHRRERRRLRTDELRAGLGVLSRAYRDRLLTGVVAGAGTGAGSASGSGPPGGAADPYAPFAAIQSATEALERNPNETLLLQALLCRLEPLQGEVSGGRRSPGGAAGRRAPGR